MLDNWRDSRGAMIEYKWAKVFTKGDNRIMKITHRQLCKIGGSYMRRRGIVPYNRCSYVVIELEHVGECPDVWGVSSGQTQLIEVKVFQK